NRFARVRAAKRRKECSLRRKPWVRSSQNGIARRGGRTVRGKGHRRTRLSPRWGSVLFGLEPPACAMGLILDAASLAEKPHEPRGVKVWHQETFSHSRFSPLVYNKAVMADELSFGPYTTTENGKKVVKELTFGNSTPEGVVLTTLDSAVNWMRKDSIWSLTFGLACFTLGELAL